ncbi:LytTR family DNA-binding domain-containing protein [Paenibacillus macerans]|nr:LytTR family DNA-binding domain-containing protein [Paenibacillus macerans]MEC0334163.1 LytTR family DNA-binding domain-containing protein [Paenibacillus macerans]MED4955887.1 LytTR family DNA-binding domain-containing protein [Paenibacillus macerans]UMV47119.1 LytTR family DNA-binding domain-containing protein [Paenibacillus macerans]
MNIAIVDDDIVYVKEIKEILERSDIWSDDMKIDSYTSAQNLIIAFSDIVYDIIFLDIETNEVGYNGISAAHYIREKYNDQIVKIIIVSSYEFYHKELYDLRPVGFIGKPIQSDEVLTLFKKCINQMTREQIENSVFLYKKQTVLKRVLQKDIVYFESEKRKMNIVFLFSQDSYYSTIKGTLRQLKTDFFIQPHESFIINLNMVREFLPNGFIMRNNQLIMTSKGRMSEIRQKTKNYLERYHQYV